MAGKADIVDRLADKFEGISKKLGTDVVEAIFEHIEESLANGEKVQVPGFGTFVVSARKERQGRNPRTGEALTIAASNNVRFKPGKKLKDAVN